MREGRLVNFTERLNFEVWQSYYKNAWKCWMGPISWQWDAGQRNHPVYSCKSQN